MKEKIKRAAAATGKEILRKPQFKPIEHIWTFIGAFIGIAVIGLIQGSRFGELDNIFLIGSFGASAVLVFGAPTTPFAQPRNLVGGHLISALVGVCFHMLIPDNYWLAASLAVSLSIVGMQITHTMHPPGGATALIANIGSEKIKSIGFGYVLSPVMSGVFVLLVTALIVNNIPKSRNYPYKK
jgi:CBS domain-containing membrane protein